MKILYDTITILPLSMLLTVLFGGYAGIPDSFAGIAVCVLCSAVWIVLRGISPRNRFRCFAVGGVFLAALLLAAGEENRQRFLGSYFWVIYAGAFSAAAAGAGILMDRSILVRRLVTAAAVLYCITGTVLAWEIRKSAFAWICLIVLVHVTEEIQRHWEKSGYPEHRAHIASISPFFLAAVLIVYLLPAPADPYDWKAAKDLYHGAVTGITRLYGSLVHPSDGYGTVGFSDNGAFFSGLGSNTQEVLRIRAGITPIRHFRLVGCISGDFRGREWIFDTGSESSTRMLDTMETACAVRKYAPASRTDFLRKVDLQYESLFYTTRYVFSPAKIKFGLTREKTPGIIEQNGSILSKRKLHYQDQYQLSCYVLNDEHPQLGALLDSAEPIGRTEWEQTAIAEKSTGLEGCSFDDYQSYRSGIYERYCHDWHVSEQTAALAADLQDGSGSRYATLKNLEGYLRNMEYSTDCGPLPASVQDGASFLDYFLFTSRKGYCMHYATAFVLMANEMGIPCRYVQGYQVRKDPYGMILVQENSAHAWPEAYFDHVGWVPFEPTPGYEVSGWHVSTSPAPVPEPAEIPSEPETEPASDTPEVPEDRSAPVDPQIFWIPAAAAVCFVLLFRLISRMISRRKYARMNASERFRFRTQQCLQLLAYLGLGMAENETLTEYLKRLTLADRQNIRAHLGFIPVYETMLYSGREITGQEMQNMEETHRCLRRIVMKSKLRFRLLLLLRQV